MNKLARLFNILLFQYACVMFFNLLLLLLLLLTLLLLLLYSVLSVLLLSRFLCRNQCVRGFGAVAEVTNQFSPG